MLIIKTGNKALTVIKEAMHKIPQQSAPSSIYVCYNCLFLDSKILEQVTRARRERLIHNHLFCVLYFRSENGVSEET